MSKLGPLAAFVALDVGGGLLRLEVLHLGHGGRKVLRKGS
jgi:hypothetical protein